MATYSIESTERDIDYRFECLKMAIDIVYHTDSLGGIPHNSETEAKMKDLTKVLYNYICTGEFDPY